jgi:shikimate dehydrogenase
VTRPISGDTILAGVVGAAAKRSLSPVIHNAWIAAAGLDAAYLPFGLQPDRFGRFIDGLRGGNLRGVNVTMPFKEAALGLADTASAAARRAGASNLLLFAQDGSVAADNTDGSGLLETLAGAGWLPANGPVAVIGAGGAARSAVAALADAGAPEVRVINRTASRAGILAEEIAGPVSAHGWDGIALACRDAAAIVNATPLGGDGQPALDLPPAPVSAVVMDMVYRPLETALLRQARAAGHRTADGLAMLIAQARPSYRAFFGHAPAEGVHVRGLCETELGAAS